MQCSYLDKVCDGESCIAWGPVILIDAAQEFHTTTGCTRLAHDQLSMHLNFVEWRKATLNDVERVLFGSLCGKTPKKERR